MKKLILLLFLIVLFYGEFHYVDLSSYQSKWKEVEVKGEVKKPGVYHVKTHALVEEIIAKAGGVTKDGDDADVNLSMDVANHSVIVIKKKSERKLISINASTLEELDTLSGIGPAIAKRIIEYRTLHPFRSLEELKEVKGIGDKLYEKLKETIIL